MLTVTVEAPTSVTRSQLREWMAQLGFNTKGLRSLRVERDGITAEFLAVDPDGNFFAVGNATQSAAHTLMIPIVEDD